MGAWECESGSGRCRSGDKYQTSGGVRRNGRIKVRQPILEEMFRQTSWMVGLLFVSNVAVGQAATVEDSLLHESVIQHVGRHGPPGAERIPVVVYAAHRFRTLHSPRFAYHTNRELLASLIQQKRRAVSGIQLSCLRPTADSIYILVYRASFERRRAPHSLRGQIEWPFRKAFSKITGSETLRIVYEPESGAASSPFNFLAFYDALQQRWILRSWEEEGEAWKQTQSLPVPEGVEPPTSE